jgi:hypothetical protein
VSGIYVGSARHRLGGQAVHLGPGARIESEQEFIPSCHPSATDLLVENSGAWLGFSVARHVRVALGAKVAPPGRVHEFCS